MSLWVIVGVAVVCRVAYAIKQVREIPANVLATVPFAQETGNIAMALAGGQGFSSPTRQNTGPTAWLPPVYPVLVAGIFRVFGTFTLHAFYAAAGLNLIFSAATCVPIYFAGRRIAGVGAASLAAWLWAMFPNAIVIPFQWIWDTSLTALLAAVILWATVGIAASTRRRRLRDWCAYGLLWGFALLTNPALGAALPFLLGWLIVREGRDGIARGEESGRSARDPGEQTFGLHDARRQLVGPAVTLACAILCCVPWTVRNYVEFHRFIPVRSNFPFELWMGNNEVFDDSSPNINARVTRYGEARLYSQLGETAFMQTKMRLAANFIRTHKRLEVRLTWWRFMSFWLGSFHPVRDFEMADSLWIRMIFVLNFLTAIGGAVGIALLWRAGNAYAFPVAVFIVVVPLVYYITHSSLRYRHPIDPVVMMLTAMAMMSAGIRKGRTFAK